MSTVEKSESIPRIYPEDLEDLVNFMRLIADLCRERNDLESKEKELRRKLVEVKQQLDDRKEIAPIMERIRKHLENEQRERSPEGNLYTQQDLTKLQTELNLTTRRLAQIRDKLRSYKSDLEEVRKVHPTLFQRAEQRFQETSSPPEHTPSLLTDQDRLQGFNLEYLDKQFQLNYLKPILIFDGFNVIGAVKRYLERKDKYELRSTRDLLISDLDFLASQIKGEYVVVFDSYHQTGVTTKYDIQIIFAGGSPGEKDKADNLIVDLVSYLKGNRQALQGYPETVQRTAKMLAESGSDQVFVITNDNLLKDRAASLGAGVINVGEVFRY